ncbi:MAG: glycosyltransferase [Pseudomonadota bacterium]
MKSPRVALLLPSTSLGGAERMIIRIANDLHTHGVDTHILLLNDTGVLTSTIEPGVTVHAVDVARARHVPVALLKILRKLAPDTVFSSHTRLNFISLTIKPFLKGQTRVVIREPSTPFEDMAVQNTERVYTPLYKLLYPKADALICQSHGMVSDFRALLGRDLDSVVQIYNPSPAPMVDAQKCDLATPYSRDAVIQLLTCGSLTHRKGYDVLLDALESFRSRGFDFQLTLLGDGPERSALESQVARLDLQDHVHFKGQTLDNMPWYLHADLFIQPSRSEGFPNTVVEALTCGTVVVASDCPGGIRELVRDGENGVLFATEDPLSLAQALADTVASLHRFPPEVLRNSVSHLQPASVFAEFRRTILGETTDAAAGTPILKAS